MTKSPFFVSLLLCLPLGLVATPVSSQPDAGMSTVPNVVYDPDGWLTYVVTVRDAGGLPVSGSVVQITFSPAADAIICWCPGQAHPVVTDTTDASGQATFQIFAGGCIDPDSVGAGISVTADAVPLATVGGVSSDAIDNNGVLPWQGWTPGGTCQAAISDVVFHTLKIRDRTYNFCTDIDSDGRVSLLDAVYLSDPFRFASTCP